MRFILLISFSFILFSGYSQVCVVHFNPGSAEISKADIPALKSIAEKYNHCQYEVNIAGYADSTGTVERNKQLSLLRAEAVKELLYKIGLNSSGATDTVIVITKSFGKDFPVADNKTKAGRQMNRRVEINIINRKCPVTASETITEISADTSSETSIEALYDLLKDKGQEFCINPLRDTALTGKDGTIVYYKAGTFENTGDCKCITIILNEYYKKSSLILNNLTTTSDESPLESGGMNKLIGLCGKDTLKFKPGKFLVVMIPTDTLLPGMKLFSANREKQSDYLNWQLDKDYSEIEGGDWSNFLRNCISNVNLKPGKCPLLFCRIRRFFSTSRKERKLERFNDKMQAEDALIKKYGLDEKQLEQALLDSKKANNDVLKYYVYKNSNWDYHNIDRFRKEEKFADLRINEPVNKSKDVKLVYQDSKTVLPPTGKITYIFRNVFDNKDVWIIGLKFRDEHSAFLSFKTENTSDKKVKLDFKVVALDELKQVLQKIDRNK